MKFTSLPAATAALTLLVSGCAPLILIGAGAEGVRTVVQERSTGEALSDTEIQLSLNNRFMNQSGRLFHLVSTDVQEGRVLLTGRVPTREDKVTAQGIAWEVPGVVSVTDEIEVAETEGVGGYARDAWISTQLRTALLTDFDISSQNYTVETIGRVVHISGIARSRDELGRVLTHAQGIGGVDRIVSHVLTIDDPRRVAQVTG